MTVEIQLRRDTAANWILYNPTLGPGEVGVESDTKLMKVGDGATPWISLTYLATVGPTGPTGPAGASGPSGATGPIDAPTPVGPGTYLASPNETIVVVPQTTQAASNTAGTDVFTGGGIAFTDELVGLPLTDYLDYLPNGVTIASVQSATELTLSAELPGLEGVSGDQIVAGEFSGASVVAGSETLTYINKPFTDALVGTAVGSGPAYQHVNGYIPAGTTVASVQSPSELTLSQEVTGGSEIDFGGAVLLGYKALPYMIFTNGVGTLANAPFTNALVGQAVTDSFGAIPAGTTVASVQSPSQLTLSAEVTDSGNLYVGNGNVITIGSGHQVYGGGLGPLADHALPLTSNLFSQPYTTLPTDGSLIGLFVTDGEVSSFGSIPFETAIASVQSSSQLTLSNNYTSGENIYQLNGYTQMVMGANNGSPFVGATSPTVASDQLQQLVPFFTDAMIGLPVTMPEAGTTNIPSGTTVTSVQDTRHLTMSQAATEGNTSGSFGSNMVFSIGITINDGVLHENGTITRVLLHENIVGSAIGVLNNFSFPSGTTVVSVVSGVSATVSAESYYYADNPSNSQLLVLGPTITLPSDAESGDVVTVIIPSGAPVSINAPGLGQYDLDVGYTNNLFAQTGGGVGQNNSLSLSFVFNNAEWTQVADGGFFVSTTNGSSSVTFEQRVVSNGESVSAATGSNSWADSEGVAYGASSHAEAGGTTYAGGSHAQGAGSVTIGSGDYTVNMVASGTNSLAGGEATHALGTGAIAVGDTAAAIGRGACATGGQSIALGFGGMAWRTGEVAEASGIYSDGSPVQMSRLTLGAETTNATPTTLSTGFGNDNQYYTTNQLLLTPDTLSVVRGTVAARSSDGTLCAAWDIQAIVDSASPTPATCYSTALTLPITFPGYFVQSPDSRNPGGTFIYTPSSRAEINGMPNNYTIPFYTGTCTTVAAVASAMNSAIGPLAGIGQSGQDLFSTHVLASDNGDGRLKFTIAPGLDGAGGGADNRMVGYGSFFGDGSSADVSALLGLAGNPAFSGGSNNSRIVSSTITKLGGDSGTSSWSVAISTSAAGANVTVTGGASTDIRWNAALSITQVGFGAAPVTYAP